MAKVDRSYFPEQDFLLSPSERTRPPENHLAYFVFDLIDQLNLSRIEQYYGPEEHGYALRKTTVEPVFRQIK